MQLTRLFSAFRRRKVPVFYLGHHKCASLVQRRIFQKMLEQAGIEYGGELPIDRLEETRKVLEERETRALSVTTAAVKTCDSLSSFRAYHVIRDPRDLLVSAYFSHRYSHNTESWPQLVEHRKELDKLSVEEGLLLEMEFGMTKWTLETIGNWDYGRPEILELKFERFVSNGFQFLQQVAVHLGLHEVKPWNIGEGSPLTDGDLEELAERHSFQAVAKREPGDEDVKHHYRKGQPGDWKNYFNDEHKKRFKELFPEAVVRSGYAPNDDW